MRLMVPLARAVRSKGATGQGSLNFDEDAHPRASKDSHGGKYKPGEFVPKGPRLTVAADPGRVSKEDAAVKMRIEFQVIATDEKTDRSETRTFDTEKEATAWGEQEAKRGRFIQRTINEITPTSIRQIPDTEFDARRSVHPEKPYRTMKELRAEWNA